MTGDYRDPDGATGIPDQRIVRELATDHILNDARRAHDIGAAVIGELGPDLDKHEYGAWCSAVRAAIETATITVSWPDAPTTTAPLAADAAQAAERLQFKLDHGALGPGTASEVRAVLARLRDLEQESEGASSPEGIADYGRWLTRNLGAAYDAGWATHADLVTGTLATLGADKRRSCARAWVTERLADLSAGDESGAVECEICTKKITGYPCVLCGHEGPGWPNGAELAARDGQGGEERG